MEPKLMKNDVQSISDFGFFFNNDELENVDYGTQ